MLKRVLKACRLSGEIHLSLAAWIPDIYLHRILCSSWDSWWEHVQQTLYAELRGKRQAAEEAAAEKARLHAQLRAAARVHSHSP